MERKRILRGRDKDLCWSEGHLSCPTLLGSWAILSIICIFVFIIMSITFTAKNILLKTRLTQLDRNIVVSEDRFTSISDTLWEYARAYPLEGVFLKESFSPFLLLKVPEIKSDEIVKSQVSLAVHYQDEIFKYQLELNRVKQKIDFYRHWLFCPSFYYVSYE